MKQTDELTVNCTVSYDTITSILYQKGFKLIEQYVLEDDYFLPNNWKPSERTYQQLLKTTVILRTIDEKEIVLLKKEKNFDHYGAITSQTEKRTKFLEVDLANSYLEKNGYSFWLHMKDTCTIFSSGLFTLILQEVQDNLFIEAECFSRDSINQFPSIEELISEFKKLELPVDETNFFVSKLAISANLVP